MSYLLNEMSNATHKEAYDIKVRPGETEQICLTCTRKKCYGGCKRILEAERNHKKEKKECITSKTDSALC